MNILNPNNINPMDPNPNPNTNSNPNAYPNEFRLQQLQQMSQLSLNPGMNSNMNINNDISKNQIVNPIESQINHIGIQSISPTNVNVNTINSSSTYHDINNANLEDIEIISPLQQQQKLKVDGHKLEVGNKLLQNDNSDNSSSMSKSQKNREKSFDENNINQDTIPKSFGEFAKMKRTNSCKSDQSDFYNIRLNEPQPDVNVFNLQRENNKLHRQNSILENSVPYNEDASKKIKKNSTEDVSFQ